MSQECNHRFVPAPFNHLQMCVWRIYVYDGFEKSLIVSEVEDEPVALHQSQSSPTSAENKQLALATLMTL